MKSSKIKSQSIPSFSSPQSFITNPTMTILFTFTYILLIKTFSKHLDMSTVTPAQ